MSRITGTIEIDFETNEVVTHTTFKMFEAQMKRVVMENVETMIDDAAHDSGFESTTMHSALLDNLECND